MGFIDNYKNAVKFSRMNLPPNFMLVLAFMLSTIVMVTAGYFIDVTFGILIALLIVDLFVGYPFYKMNKMIESVEKSLPDVLHHMATTLKTGGTIESALKEVVRMDYGEITQGLRVVLKQINEGKTFEDAFMDFATASKSELLKKSAVIIIAARKSGGALVDTLSAMADDIRAIYQLKKERRDKTFLQFLFIVFAGSIITPFVFGILKTVLQILFSVGAKVQEGDVGLLNQFDLLFKAYIVLGSALTTLGAVQVKEGKISNGVLLIPVMAIIAYVTYFITSILFNALIGI